VESNSYRAKDFIETAEGLIFAVVTEVLEEDRILSFLRYRRTSQGYRKLSSPQAQELLRNHHPDYFHYSKARDVALHGVPCDKVVLHHQARDRLQVLLGKAPGDEIEARLHHLIALFTDQGLETGEMGVTGSLLLGAQNSHSDIDLTFYAGATFGKAREIIKRLLARGLLHPLDARLWRDAYERRGCSLSFDEYLWHERRKYNKAAIDGTKFDISLLTPEHWQDLLRSRKLRSVCLRAPVADASHGFDYPARYRLDHPAIDEVVSYTATYLGQAENGEYVEIRGQLEVSAVGHLRIVIGSDREATDEYIKVMPNPRRIIHAGR
jgi:hypothetical protein